MRAFFEFYIAKLNPSSTLIVYLCTVYQHMNLYILTNKCEWVCLVHRCGVGLEILRSVIYHQSKRGQEQVFRGTSRGNPVPARCWMICYPDNWLCLMRGQRGLSWWWGGEKSSKSIFSWAGTIVTVMFQDCDAVIAWSEQKALSGADLMTSFSISKHENWEA